MRRAIANQLRLHATRVSKVRSLLQVAAVTLLVACSADSVVEPPPPPPPTPSLSQTSILQNGVEIRYTATLENVAQAILAVFRNAEPTPLITRTISDSGTSGADFEAVFTYANDGVTKGIYRFVLTAGAQETTSNVEVPNYLPDVDLSSLDLDLDEDSQITRTLLLPLDANPEDNPVLFTGVDFPPGGSQKVSVTLAAPANELLIQADQDEVGLYQLLVSFGSAEGGSTSATLEGQVYDLLDIQGYLEDNETDSRQQGEIRIYDSDQNQLGTFAVDNPSGEFSGRLPYRIVDLTDEILIQARMRHPSTGENLSYVRTLRLASGDVSERTIRVVPYGGLYDLSGQGITVEDFYRHMAEVLTRDSEKPETDPLTWNPMIFKWADLPEIIISMTDWRGPEEGYFSQASAEITRNRFLDSDDIGALFDGKMTSGRVTIVDNHIYDSSRDSGKIIVYPSRSAVTGVARDTNRDGYADFGRIRIGVGASGELGSSYNLPHEVFHAKGYLGHAKTLDIKKTHQASGGAWPPPNPKFAERKLSKIDGEDTYIHGEGTLENGRLGLRDVLGLKWKNE